MGEQDQVQILESRLQAVESTLATVIEILKALHPERLAEAFPNVPVSGD